MSSAQLAMQNVADDMAWIPGGVFVPAARMTQGIDTSTCPLGFRTILRPAVAG